MKIFLDTSNIDEIKSAYNTGMIDGVTTNPSLIAKEGKDFKEVINEIVEIFKDTKDTSISAEVISTNAQEMIKEAKELVKIHKFIVIKVPIIPEGIIAIKELSNQGIKTNATLCFSANQALLAAKAGATYVSPFLGRLDDIGVSSLDLIKEIRTIYDNFDFKTEILSASIRSVDQVSQVASLGSDIITLPPKIFKEMFKHDLTDKGLAAFLKDWEELQNKLDK
ncbi:fructose-6-phosphate aldolase [bacterium]|jgi:transaldolase|nr:fructose-6-phosphate aldolase [bacterium]MBT4122143.1 fructose-6-phosphate aldolase [bacterium]MBT4334979.1 fructose-6-phosphate aldolase [bacterium]MBT4496038.1 fructose-6-phosphate aldolase [bacterium]MBT4764033.1 fructose-6-phosphate aldolase [bacterium]